MTISSWKKMASWVGSKFKKVVILLNFLKTTKVIRKEQSKLRYTEWGQINYQVGKKLLK